MEVLEHFITENHMSRLDIVFFPDFFWEFVPKYIFENI